MNSLCITVSMYFQHPGQYEFWDIFSENMAADHQVYHAAPLRGQR